MKLGTLVGLSPGHIVLGGDPAPPPQRGIAPQFSAHICCGQMAAWIKMLLGMELGLDPGDYCGQTAGWIKMVLGMDIGLSQGDFVLDGDPDPATLLQRGRSPLPNFQPISVVAKWLDASRCHLVWR